MVPLNHDARWVTQSAQRDYTPLTSAGLDGSGAILVRPDGHIGFRASPADAAGLQALDQHLDSSLIAA